MKTSTTSIPHTRGPEQYLTEEELREWESRWAISPAGFAYVKGRPGDRKITSEEIYAALKDFP